MSSKTHDRETFCKYTSAHVVILILSNLKIRFSSPQLFNDPFDCAHRFDYGFDIIEAKKPYVEECLRIVYGDELLPGDMKNPAYQALIRLRNDTAKAVQREQLEKLLNDHFVTATEKTKTTIRDVNILWTIINKIRRVLCVTEDYDNILMWSHYSDFHKGAVLSFRCIEEDSTALCAAQKVTYSDYTPSIFPNVESCVVEMTGQVKFNTDKFYERFVLTKSQHWAYEKEWRAITYRDANQSELYFDNKVLPQEVEAVYLGCKISAEDKDQIMNLLVGELSHVKVYQGSKDKYKYALNFEQIK